MTEPGLSFAVYEETPTVLRKGSLRLPNMKRPRPYFGRGLLLYWAFSPPCGQRVAESYTCSAIWINSANADGLRLAPPINPPSTEGRPAMDAKLAGLTLPPYKIATELPIAVPRSCLRCSWMRPCACSICSFVAFTPVPIAHTGCLLYTSDAADEEDS